MRVAQLPRAGRVAPHEPKGAEAATRLRPDARAMPHFVTTASYPRPYFFLPIDRHLEVRRYSRAFRGEAASRSLVRTGPGKRSVVGGEVVLARFRRPQGPGTFDVGPAGAFELDRAPHPLVAFDAFGNPVLAYLDNNLSTRPQVLVALGPAGG